MKFKILSTGYAIMDIPERDFLLKALDLYTKNKTVHFEQEKLFDSLIIFVDYLIEYCSSELDVKAYSFDHVIPQLFKLNIKKDQQFKQFLHYSLYTLQQYLNCLKNYKLHIENIRQYYGLIPTLVSDAEWLLVNYELYCKKSIEHLELKCAASRQLCTRDLVSTMNELFFIEDINDLTLLDIRDLKPNVMFIIRQLLETMGNNLIGFRRIVNKNKEPIYKFSQVSWKFLKNNNVAKQNISLPYNINSIYILNKWANCFVHSRHLFASYIQYYALDFINKLMTGPSSPVLCHDGKIHISTLFGNFRIEHYNSLKKEFETYVKEKMPDAIVDWLPITEVGAYIISL